MAKPTAQEFVAALRRVEEEGEVEAMAALYADDAQLMNPTDRTPHVGPDGARRFWEAYRKSFETIRSRFHAVLESEGRIMLEWTSDCRTAAGVETAYDGVSVVETRDGRIARFSAYFDPTQLTAHPPVETEMRPSGRAPLADQAPAGERGGDAGRASNANAEANA
jgi:ketosteroid isomerase-like protein